MPGVWVARGRWPLAEWNGSPQGPVSAVPGKGGLELYLVGLARYNLPGLVRSGSALDTFNLGT